MKKMKNLLIILFIVIAVTFGFLGYKFTGPSQPTIVVKEVQSPKPELPKDFPRELITDEQPQNLTVSVDDNQTMVVYASNLKLEELFNKFLASIKLMGWKIMSQVKSDFQIKAGAKIQPGTKYYKEGAMSDTVEVWFTKISDTTTRVFIKYQK